MIGYRKDATIKRKKNVLSLKIWVKHGDKWSTYDLDLISFRGSMMGSFDLAPWELLSRLSC